MTIITWMIIYKYLNAKIAMKSFANHAYNLANLAVKFLLYKFSFNNGLLQYLIMNSFNFV